MADVTLNAQVRTIIGKQVRALRRQGIIPANVYGRGIDSVAVQFALRDLRDVLIQAGATTVVDLHVSPAGGGDAQPHPVLIETITREPGRGRILHIDFRQVDLNRPVRTDVPIVLLGEAPAVQQGGVVVQSLDTLAVEALPRSLPHEIPVDISRLAAVDDQITVGDITLPAGVTAQVDAEIIVVRIIGSRLEAEVAAEEAVTADEAAAATEEAAAGEPEADGSGAPSGA
ncbi:MAG: 50S ribosomal protein L25 [Chloroflexota bacterium]|nr:50S ribosomal protein L25 [Chloroflexota bacterium]